MNQDYVSLQNSIVTLSAHGWSARKIARKLGLNGETVGRYPRLAANAEKPAIPPIGSPDSSDPKPAISPIYQDLVIEHRFNASYDSVKRFVRSLEHKTAIPFWAHGVCMIAPWFTGGAGPEDW